MKTRTNKIIETIYCIQAENVSQTCLLIANRGLQIPHLVARPTICCNIKCAPKSDTLEDCSITWLCKVSPVYRKVTAPCNITIYLCCFIGMSITSVLNCGLDDTRDIVQCQRLVFSVTWHDYTWIFQRQQSSERVELPDTALHRTQLIGIHRADHASRGFKYAHIQNLTYTS